MASGGAHWGGPQGCGRNGPVVLCLSAQVVDDGCFFCSIKGDTMCNEVATRGPVTLPNVKGKAQLCPVIKFWGVHGANDVLNFDTRGNQPLQSRVWGKVTNVGTFSRAPRVARSVLWLRGLRCSKGRHNQASGRGSPQAA